jgi:hypothetical protein
MKRAGCTTRRQLSVDSARETELSFNYHVHQIVRHERVVTRRWMHHHIRQPRALRFH